MNEQRNCFQYFSDITKISNYRIEKSGKIEFSKELLQSKIIKMVSARVVFLCFYKPQNKQIIKTC